MYQCWCASGSHLFIAEERYSEICRDCSLMDTAKEKKDERDAQGREST